MEAMSPLRSLGMRTANIPWGKIKWEYFAFSFGLKSHFSFGRLDIPGKT